MRIRILSGQQVGCVQDFPQTEGEVLIATGFGELVTDVVETAAAAVAVEAIEPAHVGPEAIEPAPSDDVQPDDGVTE